MKVTRIDPGLVQLTLSGSEAHCLHKALDISLELIADQPPKAA